MTTKEIKEQSEAMKKSVKKATSSKEDAAKFLADTGVYTKKGNLKKRFK